MAKRPVKKSNRAAPKKPSSKSKKTVKTVAAPTRPDTLEVFESRLRDQRRKSRLGRMRAGFS